MNVFWWRPTTDRVGYLGYRLWGDAFYYHHQANALADGKFFIDPIRYVFDGVEVPSAGHPPLYSIYLAFWSTVGIDGVTAHRVVSGLLGVATIVVVGLVGKRIAGAAVGVIAATIVADLPVHLDQRRHGDVGVDGGARGRARAARPRTTFVRSPTTRHAVFLGLACGAGALTRTEMALLFPLLLRPARAPRPQPGGSATVQARGGRGASSARSLIAPWVTFNLARFEEPVLPEHGDRPHARVRKLRRDLLRQGHRLLRDVLHRPVPRERRRVAARPGAARVRDRLHRGSQVARTARRRRARRTPLGRVQARADHRVRLVDRRDAAACPSWISLFCYYAMIPFAVGGSRRMRRRKITILPVVVPIVIATFAAATTFGITRYRAPAEVGLVLAASIGDLRRVDVAPRRDAHARRGAELTTEATIATPRPPTSRRCEPALHTMASLRRPEGTAASSAGSCSLTLVGAAVRVMNVLWWRPTTSRDRATTATRSPVTPFYYHLAGERAGRRGSGSSTRSAG